MKITIESTEKIVEVEIDASGLGVCGIRHTAGVPARIWEGHTDSGIPVHCYVTRIAVARDQDCAQFDRELAEQRAPSAAVEAIPLRMIL